MLTFLKLRKKAILPVALIVSFVFATPVNSGPIKVSPRFHGNTISGQSGGKINSRGCGFISNKPTQVIEVTERINYLRIAVTARSGQPTLLIKGPNGNLCAINSNPEIAGVWVPGKYSIYVGDRSNSRHNFTLSISQKK